MVEMRCCFVFRVCDILHLYSVGAYDSMGAIIISAALSISAMISSCFLVVLLIMPSSMFCSSFSWIFRL